MENKGLDEDKKKTRTVSKEKSLRQQSFFHEY